MKIQLIHPPLYINPKAFTTARPSLPLGLAYVAAALEAQGHEVGVIDALAEAPEQTVREGRVLRLGLSPDEIVDRIDRDTEVVGVTNMWSFAWPIVRELIHTIKERRPDVIVICGGEHFNGLPELSMETAPIDYIVRGEGEETATELLAALASADFDPARIAGLVWRDGDRLVTNPPRARIKAVDDLPWPAWHLFDLDVYNRHGMKTGTDYGFMVPILATRGCPYQCTYCSSPRMWTTRWTARDPVRVVDEIQHWAETYGADNFPFQDLTVIIRRDWIVAFCREIIRRQLKIQWQLPTGTRCEVVDDEVARLLHESGCRSLAYAPESGSDETRRLIKKRMKRDALFGAVDAAVRHGIDLTCFLVLGFPHDRDRHLWENVRFVRQLARHGVQDIVCAFFFPIPATELFDSLRAKGRLELSDESLLAPILGHDRYLTADRNYAEHVPAWRMTFYKYWLVLNFYAFAFLRSPLRIYRIASSVIRGREESRLDRFLIHYTRRLGRSMARPFSLRERRRRAPSEIEASIMPPRNDARSVPLDGMG